MSHDDAENKRYEAPTLTVLGSFHGATQCVFGKTVGDPDFFLQIPIANCS
jgi:hypothetical protein